MWELKPGHKLYKPWHPFLCMWGEPASTFQQGLNTVYPMAFAKISTALHHHKQVPPQAVSVSPQSPTDHTCTTA